MADTASFCTHCGTTSKKHEASTEVSAVDDGGGAPDAAEPEPQSHDETVFHDSAAAAIPVAASDAPEDHAQPNEGKVCSGCGSSVDGALAFCTTCGTPTASAEPGATEPIPVVPTPRQDSAVAESDDEEAGSQDDMIEITDTVEIAATAGVIDPVSTSGCPNCGEDLEPGAAFCISCGNPVVVAGGGAATAPVPSQPAAKNRSRKVAILAALVVAVLLLGAAGAWAFFGGGESAESEEASVASEPTQGQSDDAAAASAETTSTTTASQSCIELAVAAADAARAMTTEFSGISVKDLSLLTRTGSDALPGVVDFKEEWKELSSQATSAGCDQAIIQSDYTSALGGATNPSDVGAAFAHSALSVLTFGQDDPVGLLAAALLLNPLRGEVSAQPATAEVEPPRWVVLLSSLNTSDNTDADASKKADGFTATGIPADFLLTDGYASLTPGYWAVFSGPFVDRDAAKDYCISVKDQVPDCYQRYVQDLPSTDPPYGQCGPYGMVDVTGVGSTKTIILTSRPEDGRGEVGILSGAAKGILVAGPAVEADGLWTPVVSGVDIGWIRNGFVADNATCPRTIPKTVARSCVDIAAATLEVYRGVISEANAIEASGNLSAAAAKAGQLDVIVTELAVDAAVAGCSAAEMNALLSAGRNEIPVEGVLAPLVVRALYANTLFTDG